ncbi:MAG TPA: hypothetical protein VFA81_04860 [Burkholderiales bacterium]|nr:hypothetical protein [Burkholderiales bacterium]
MTLQGIQDDLLARHGELMTGEPLRRALGFASERSFLRAAKGKNLPVRVFELAGRRGRFARTRDVAQWLSTLV